MGSLKINGVSILNYTTPRNKSKDIGKANPAFNKITGLIGGNRKIIVGWKIPDANSWSTNANYDVCKGKLKVNGTVQSVGYNGNRPMNTKILSWSGSGSTWYLNNVNGSLYVSSSPNSTSGTLVVSTTTPNKDIIINLVCFGAGGKGGGGAYWFLAGNWGGVGGAGGGKVLVTCCVKNNDHFKIVTDSDSSKTGRTSNSNDTTYESPGIHVYKSTGEEWLVCYGGRSGTSNHPRWSQDNYQGGGTYSVQTYGNLPFVLRQSANGGNKTQNGLSGSNGNFKNSYFPSGGTSTGYGNVESHLGEFKSLSDGGTGPDSSYAQGHGSGGAGGYGTKGGNAGDTGSGSNGSGGSLGGGGGGSGSPAGGANGGDGGHPGFVVIYSDDTCSPD